MNIMFSVILKDYLVGCSLERCKKNFDVSSHSEEHDNGVGDNHIGVETSSQINFFIFGDFLRETSVLTVFLKMSRNH